MCCTMSWTYSWEACFYQGELLLSVLCTGAETDIIDEALLHFKANVFFKSYEVKVCNYALINVSHKTALDLGWVWFRRSLSPHHVNIFQLATSKKYSY